MLKINYYLKTDKINVNRESPIFAKLSFENQSITISTSRSISKERWAITHNLRTSLKIEKEKVIRQGLDAFKLKAERKFNELILHNEQPSLENLKEILLNRKPKKVEGSITIMTLFQQHNAYFLRKVKSGERAAASFQKYERSKDLLRNFLLKSYNSADIAIDRINSALIYNLEAFLKYDSQYKQKLGIKNNTVVKYFKSYKTVCNYGIKMNLIIKNPFAKYDGKLQIQDAVYLSKEELERIEQKKFSIERLAKVRDMFLFSCYTGYAPVDAAKLTNDNLLRDSNGDLWLRTVRTKTNIRANVPVLPPALKIIERYSNSDYLIPRVSNQKMNAYLKEIADVCGIKTNLTWYVARHTFATTVTLGNGVKLENVSAMMGHTNIKQTQHYAKILDQNVMSDMKKLMSAFE